VADQVSLLPHPAADPSHTIGLIRSVCAPWPCRGLPERSPWTSARAGASQRRGTRAWRGRCPSLRLSGAVLQRAPASRSPGEDQASHPLAACGVGLAPHSVVTVVWRWSRRLARCGQAQFLYVTWQMHGVLL
jgi:hypothetical protein